MSCNKFHFLIHKHFTPFVIAIITICVIITTIWFVTMDPNEDPNLQAFNRTIIKDSNDNLKYATDPFTDACYFTFTTISTVGYGDITPRTAGAKYWTMIIQGCAIFISLRLFEYFINLDECQHELLTKKNSVMFKSSRNILSQLYKV